MKTQQGFTLIEAMITLAVLGIGLAGSAKLQSLVFSHMLNAKAQHEAMLLSIKQIEALRYQIIYEAEIPNFPIRQTHTGIHSRYQLQAKDISVTQSNNAHELEIITRWRTPGTEGQLTVSSIYSRQPYAQSLYRLREDN